MIEKTLGTIVCVMALTGCANDRWHVVQATIDRDAPILIDSATGDTWRLEERSNIRYWEKLDRHDMRSIDEIEAGDGTQ